jgi:biotin carboxyl carrier protein
MIYVVNINDKSYEVEVEQGKANIIKTTTVAAQAPIVQAAPAAATAPQAAAPAGNITGEPVKSPMPGAILDVKASVGATVKKGQLLFILEAMKMENEIFSTIDGVVSQIMVSKGSSVSTNDILMVIQ